MSTIIEDRKAEIDAALVVPHPAPDVPVYHFTTPYGFKAIVESGSLWATHHRFLNDPSEMSEGDELVVEVAQALRSDGLDRGDLLDVFIKDWETDRPSRLVDSCVASFSQTVDRRGPWAEYANKGRGYALGFFGCRPLDYPTVRWVRCEYSKRVVGTAAREMFLQAVDLMGRTWVDLRPDSEEFAPVAGYLQGRMAIRAAEIAMRLKHEAYEEEQEWRIVIFPNLHRPVRGMEFRATDRGLTPYVNLDISVDGLLPLSDVVVGPNLHRETALESAVLFLGSQGYVRPEQMVRCSGLPYRA